MQLRVLNVQDAADYQLCCGCGACAYVGGPATVMVDVPEHGRRPVFDAGGLAAAAQAESHRFCPGLRLEHDRIESSEDRQRAAAWGPIREVWEGFAADEELRFAGSSGGAISALGMFALERLGFYGVLHTAADDGSPLRNGTVLSRTREELLARTGSRYAPASPCERLDLVELAPAPCVFVGKPCDCAAVRQLSRQRPALDRKVGIMIAFFCAGTPTTQGTLELLRAMGVEDPDTVTSLRYRGNGWPGRTVATVRTTAGPRTTTLEYEEAWPLLARHKQWRCKLCPDHTGEFADIAVGDPWHRPIEPGEAGRSLIVARTARGLAFVRQAIDAGYLQAVPGPPSLLRASQENLLRARAQVWGRIWGLRMIGAPVPVFRRLPMARWWWSELGWRERVASVFGAIRRARRSGVLRRSRAAGGPG